MATVILWFRIVLFDVAAKFSSMASKRSSSPLEQWGNDKRTCKDMDYLPSLVDRSVVNQMKMIEQHVFKERLCRELKEKHDRVDKNCLNWHDFAVDMQQRVKRLVVILGRQQESIKSLKLKSNPKTSDASVQTDDLGMLPPLNLLSKKNPLKSTVKSETSAPKENSADPSKIKQSKPNDPSAVIDLTGNDDDDCDLPDTKSSSLNDRKDFETNLCSSSRAIGLKTETIHGEHASGLNSAIPVKQAAKVAGGSGTVKSLSAYAQESKPDITERNIPTAYPALPHTPLPPKILPKGKLPPPFQPELKLRKSSEGLELSWDYSDTSKHAEIECYEIYLYQHNHNNMNQSNRWKKIKSDPIKAMRLPMACTLSQYSSKSSYYFAVRGRDIYGRYGKFSEPCCSSSLD